jgi:hypothetical protein
MTDSINALSLLEEARQSPSHRSQETAKEPDPQLIAQKDTAAGEKTEPLSPQKDTPGEQDPSPKKEESAQERDPQDLKEKIKSLEERFKKTQAWARKTAQEKTDVLKKLSDLAEEGHIDEEDLQKYRDMSEESSGQDFWQTVESQVKGYVKTFGTPELEDYLNAFKQHAQSLLLSDHKKFEDLEEELAQTPQEEWVKFTLDKGKEYYNTIYKHLKGRSIHDAYLDLLQTSEKLKKKLEKQTSEKASTERPLLNGGAVGSEDDSDASHVSALSLLEHARRARLNP